MRSKAASALALVAAGGLLLAVAGCGGGGGDKAADVTQAAPTTTAPATTESTPTETHASSGSPTFASVANCKQLAELGQKLSEAMGASGAKANTEKTAEFLREFADQTPKEIRADFQLIAATYTKIAKALEGVDTTSGKALDPQALAKLQKIASEIDQPALTKAETHISTWVTTNCTQK
jgi:hypothetical protein